jgi:hypothetical protein
MQSKDKILFVILGEKLALRQGLVRYFCVLPYAALLFLDGNNAGPPLVALVFALFHHMHRKLVSSSNHSTYCTRLNAHKERYDD